MRKTILFPVFILILIAVFFTIKILTKEKSPTALLEKVLQNLEQIESASYFTKTEAWAPGDTAASFIYYSYVKEFNNPLDTTIGASFVYLDQKDTTQMRFSYDGTRKAVVYKDSKSIVIDSFNLRKLPFRPITPPFFNYAKSIIKYALETEDSISVNIEDIGASLYFKLQLVGDKQLEFFGKAIQYENPFGFGEEISQYEIWIEKPTGLPFKIRRELSHDISVRTCSNAIFNKLKIADFKASDYFQKDYSIKPYRLGGSSKTSFLEGKPAPDWILNDVDGNSFALQDLKSKVVLVEFTSVSCGPCKAAIPFLKKLVTEYNKDDFDFVSIEAFAKNSNVLKVYQQRNDFNYKFLLSTKEVSNSYYIKSIPVFFLLDENRIIRKVINGYGASVDKQIRDAINELI